MRNEFESNGFVVLKQSQNWLNAHSAICYQFTKLFMGDTPNVLPEALCWNVGDQNKIQKIDNVHLISEPVLRLIYAKELINHVRELTGARKIQLNSSHLFFKPVGSGDNGNVGWHTDVKNVANEQLNIVVACIPLGVLQKNSGNMKFLKGSHRWQGNSEHAFNDGSCTNVEHQQKQIANIAPAGHDCQEVFAYTSAQEFSIHNGNIWHCSGPNTSSVPRLSLSISMHVQSDTSSYCLPDLSRYPMIFNDSGDGPV